MKGIPWSMLLLLLCGSPATADWGPWEVPAEKQQRAKSTEPDPLQQTVKLFQKYISPVDGARCPMYPTCSGYASQALHQHGPVIGMLMTVDRLFREADPLEKQEKIIKWGTTRFYDPLEKNDFWWHSRGNHDR